MSNKREHAIDEEVQITLIVTEATYKCEGCFFNGKEGCLAYQIDDAPDCTGRTDNKDVIFKLKKK